MNAFWASENFDAFMLPLLLPAGRLSRKTPIKNGPVFGDQSKGGEITPNNLSGDT
jgi:hypothetical protein